MSVTDGSASSTSGELIKRARQRGGWTQRETASQSQLSVRTIRALENGTGARPRRSSIVRLTRALRLSPEETARLLREWDRGGDVEMSLGELNSVLGGRLDIAAVLADRFDDLHLTFASRSIVVDSDGYVRSERVERVVHCARGGPDSAFLVVVPGLTPIEGVRIIATDACEVRRRLDFTDVEVVVFEMSFPRALRAGDQHAFAVDIEQGGDAVSNPRADGGVDVCGTGFARPPAMVVVRARFDSPRPPVHFWHVYRSARASTLQELDEIDGGRHAQLVLTTPPAGWHGLQWRWPGAES